jgi:hypothetical protein
VVIIHDQYAQQFLLSGFQRMIMTITATMVSLEFVCFHNKPHIYTFPLSVAGQDDGLYLFRVTLGENYTEASSYYDRIQVDEMHYDQLIFLPTRQGEELQCFPSLHISSSFSTELSPDPLQAVVYPNVKSFAVIFMEDGHALLQIGQIGQIVSSHDELNKHNNTSSCSKIRFIGDDEVSTGTVTKTFHCIQFGVNGVVASSSLPPPSHCDGEQILSRVKEETVISKEGFGLFEAKAKGTEMVKLTLIGRSSSTVLHFPGLISIDITICNKSNITGKQHLSLELFHSLMDDFDYAKKISAETSDKHEFVAAIISCCEESDAPLLNKVKSSDVEADYFQEDGRDNSNQMTNCLNYASFKLMSYDKKGIKKDFSLKGTGGVVLSFQANNPAVKVLPIYNGHDEDTIVDHNRAMGNQVLQFPHHTFPIRPKMVSLKREYIYPAPIYKRDQIQHNLHRAKECATIPRYCKG